MTSSESAAVEYLRRGWSIVPLEPGSKLPLLRWQAFQSRHATLEELRDWYRRWPTANVGVVTGALSGLVVLDIDAGHGGFVSLPELEGHVGLLPRSIEATSGGGGRHCYFVHPGGVVRNRVGILPGIDLRGDGGYIVAPPSVHPNGRRYAWVSGRSPQKIALAPLPQRLLGWIRRHSAHGHSLEHWRGLVRNGATEGERNNTIASLAGHLLWHGVDENVALALLIAWNRVRCRPPLDDAEVTSVVASIAKRHSEHEWVES